MDDNAQLVYYQMIRGSSVTQATYMLNVHRENLGMPLVCRSTVQRLLTNSKMVAMSARDSMKTGKSDMNTP